MFGRILTILLVLCSSVLIYFVVDATRRPLCIDSRIVDRIDRVSNNKPLDGVFRCALKKDTAFSLYFFEKITSIYPRIQKMERVLESIAPFEKKIQITIVKDRPFLFKVKGQAIFIGEELLKAPGHIEKAMAKIWFEEKSKHYFAQQLLLEEVISDFLVFLAQGDLDIGDPDTLIVTRLQRMKWPYILKSVPSYCETPWKRSEHYTVCRNSPTEEPLMDTLVTEMSLRPMLTHAWIQAFRDLPMRDRHFFVKSLAPALLDEPREKLPLLMATHLEEKATSLAKAVEAIKNMTVFLTRSEQIKSSKSFRIFVSNFSNQLALSGFKDSFVEATFDILYASDTELDPTSPSFQQFIAISNQNPKLQIAIHDHERLWILPSQHPINLSSFGSMKAHISAVEKCGAYDFNYVMAFADRAEKVIVINHCDKAQKLNYKGLINSGVEQFARENPKTTFVQFHLPSLMMKSLKLVDAGDVLEFIKKRDVDHESFQSLGWSEVQWIENAKAYRPKASIDAIEWFRIEN